MRMSYRKSMLMAAGLCSLVGCGTASRETLTAEQRQRNLASFEYVWETVRDRHFDPNYNGQDWDALRAEYEPQVADARTMGPARQAMREMLGRLGQTHFGIFPAEAYASMNSDDDEDDSDEDGSAGGSVEAADDETDEDEDVDEHGSCGIAVRVLNGEAVVTAVHAGSPADSAGVKTGWLLQSANGRETARAIEIISEEYTDSTLLDLVLSRGASRRLDGDVGDAVDLVFLDGDDNSVEMTLTRMPARGERTKVMSMPEVVVWAEHRKLEGDIGYVYFDGFWHPGHLMGVFNEAMEAYMDGQGLIIDIRGNGGGIGALSMGMAGWLIGDKNQQLGTMYTRRNEINFAVFPRATTFAGPVAVLTDGLSASTSEIFAGGLKDLGRARIFGTRTAGAALPSAIERLPNGDGFQYAFANYISSGGEVLEGNGVIPDQEVHLTRAALLAGRDAVLDTAVAWIQSNPVADSTN